VRIRVGYEMIYDFPQPTPMIMVLFILPGLQIVPSASQHAVEDLPAETIVYLLGSRYCET
jgi:hypothetical protein